VEHAQGLVILFLLLFSGYITARSSVPDYWIWSMYTNPFFFSFQGLCTNEFRSATYDKLTPTGQTIGEVYLENRWEAISIGEVYLENRWEGISQASAAFLFIPPNRRPESQRRVPGPHAWAFRTTRAYQPLPQTFQSTTPIAPSLSSPPPLLPRGLHTEKIWLPGSIGAMVALLVSYFLIGLFFMSGVEHLPAVNTDSDDADEAAPTREKSMSSLRVSPSLAQVGPAPWAKHAPVHHVSRISRMCGRGKS
jgi:hypothetical protein